MEEPTSTPNTPTLIDPTPAESVVVMNRMQEIASLLDEKYPEADYELNLNAMLTLLVSNLYDMGMGLDTLLALIQNQYEALASQPISEPEPAA